MATGLAAAPAGAAPTWVAPAVTLAEGTSARPPADSHVVVDAAGNATSRGSSRWHPPTTTTTCRSSTHPLGGPWSAPLNISGTGYIFDEIDIATNANGVTVAVWTRNTADTDVLEAATRAPGGAWSAPVPVGDSTANAETPQVGVDATGNAVLTWMASEPGDYLRYATKPAGGSWSAADDVSDPAEGLGQQRLRLSSSPRAGRRPSRGRMYLPIDDRRSSRPPSVPPADLRRSRDHLVGRPATPTCPTSR